MRANSVNGLMVYTQVFVFSDKDVAIPEPMLSSTKWTANGYPDKRYSSSIEALAWIERGGQHETSL